MRNFVGIDLSREPVPDETTICKFRHLIERHDLGDALFRLVNVYLEKNGMKVARGTIVDASIINAQSSIKDKERDPEMHQTRKGKQWYFGMKAHMSVDSRSKMIHSVLATAANVHDSQVLEDPLHGEETRAWGDSAYAKQKQVLREKSQNAKELTQHKDSRHQRLSDEDQSRDRNKSRVRSRVVHSVQRNTFNGMLVSDAWKYRLHQ